MFKKCIEIYVHDGVDTRSALQTLFIEMKHDFAVILLYTRGGKYLYTIVLCRPKINKNRQTDDTHSSVRSWKILRTQLLWAAVAGERPSHLRSNHSWPRRMRIVVHRACTSTLYSITLYGSVSIRWLYDDDTDDDGDDDDNDDDNSNNNNNIFFGNRFRYSTEFRAANSGPVYEIGNSLYDRLLLF